MKSILSFIVLFYFSSLLFCQGYEEMSEDESTSFESLSASYEARFIKNRKTQDVYDIEISIRNNGHDLIMLKRDIGTVEYSLKPYAIAEFRFDNATGSNLTVKDGFMVGNEVHKDITYECEKCNGGDDETVLKKDRFLLGYGIRRRDIVDETFRIRVPKGEKPEIRIRFPNN